VKTITEISYKAKDHAALNSNILLLSKKHGQLKSAVQSMVEMAMGWLDEIKKRDGNEKWLELVETLRSVTEGKVPR
jgi:26S proteasome regulatory subunit N5